jgi:hypothetical protein
VYDLDGGPGGVCCDGSNGLSSRLSEPSGSMADEGAGSPLREGHIDASILLVDAGRLRILVSKDADCVDVDVVSDDVFGDGT